MDVNEQKLKRRLTMYKLDSNDSELPQSLNHRDARAAADNQTQLRRRNEVVVVQRWVLGKSEWW